MLEGLQLGHSFLDNDRAVNSAMYTELNCISPKHVVLVSRVLTMSGEYRVQLGFPWLLVLVVFKVEFTSCCTGCRVPCSRYREIGCVVMVKRVHVFQTISFFYSNAVRNTHRKATEITKKKIK